MNKQAETVSNRESVSTNNMCVDIKGLQKLLCCGSATARKIGNDSKAGFNVGRRKLYKVDIVNAYIENLIEK